MTVIRHGHIVTMDENYTEYSDGAIVFDENGIIFVGNDKDLPLNYQKSSFEDFSGSLIFPGLCNLHTHLGMVSFRSLADDYPDRLNRFLMPLENEAMTRNLTAASAKVAISEMLLSGVTSAVDMYYFESDIAKASAQMGFRLWAGETFLNSSRPDGNTTESAFAECDKIISISKENPLISAVVAPHAPYSVSMQTLHACYEYAVANDLLWTMHLCEMPYEIESFKTKYNASPIKTLANENILDSRLIAAHLLLVSKDDIDILSQHKTSVAHCPGSNSKAAKGVSPVPELIDAGCFCGLGTDGPASGNTLDIFTQMKLYAVLQKNRLHDRSAVPAKDIVTLATRNAGYILKKNIGMLKQGYQADLMTLSLSRPNMIPCYDPYSVMVYSSSPQNVGSVFVNGIEKVKDGHFTFNFEEIRNEFSKASADFESKARKRL